MKKNQEHICFDLETLGNGPTAPIIQIGAVKFNLEKGIYDKFSINIDYPNGIPNCYAVDHSTIMWWFQQSSEARDSFKEFPKETLTIALAEFNNWIGVSENYLYWSMSTFDVPILTHAFKSQFVPALPYRNFRDFRTIVDIFDIPKPDTKLISHVGVDDAEFEALQIISALNIHFNG